MNLRINAMETNLVTAVSRTPVSKYQFFALLERVFPRELNESDEKWFKDCNTLEKFMNTLISSEVFRVLGLEGNSLTLSRLSEFYVCLLADVKWRPSVGFDALDAFQLHNMIKAGTVEVKHSAAQEQWGFESVGRTLEFKANILVFLGYHDLNPCNTSLFVFPDSVLIPETQRQLKQRERNGRRIRSPHIRIAKRRINFRKGGLNKWWEYEIQKHSDLRQAIKEHIHGEFEVLSIQLPLF